jgi:hypothetical protein
MIITKNYYMNGLKICFWLPQLSTWTALSLPIFDLNENSNNLSNKFARQILDDEHHQIFDCLEILA